MKRAFVFALSLSAAACAGEGGRSRLFSTDWRDDQGKSIGDVYARLRGAQPGASADVVVAVAGNNDKILALPLGRGSAWTHQHALDTRPVVTGGVVVASGGGELIALDVATGKKLWARPTGGVPMLGAGDDGALTAVTLSRGRGSTLLVVARDGTVRRQIETPDKVLGDPAVVAGVVFVPWGNQYVSAIDVTSGDEIGRVTLRDKVSRALSIGGTLYFGELAYVRFDDRITQASRGGATRVTVPSRELPGTPRLLVPGTEKLPPGATARDRDRLFARPAGEASAAVDSGRFYASYFRLAFGFDAKTGELAWVHTHGADLIGGEAVQGGLLVCDERGKVIVLDARTGQPSDEKSFPEPIKSCVAQADTFRAPPSSGAAPPLVQQITDALATREASLATAHRLLVRELATKEDESATKTLIELASDPRTAPIVVTDARAALATRRNGASYMLAALAKHYDYLHDVLASPPVGPIADALAAMKEGKAAPLLAAHLLDPADTDDDVRRAAAALAVLATKDERKALEQFFAMYRGTAETEEIAVAVGSAAEALLRVAGKEGRAIVEAAAKDAMTNPAARARLEALLTASAGDKAAGDKPAGEKPAGGKPAGDKPAGDKPAGDKPAGGKPAGDKPAGSK